ncbi:glycosyltransferase family 2 protein [Reinekea sp. G2M2-21]|uniref:glycosyltransferase family 2 protein n=1 Tax=Reinekea sp. G2M2-21 TaxID=2788942 RepID=UPI0018AC38FB|nr:glycosyltransferase family 2 protein [Reinekea sp. G2M2-21]
MKPQKIGIVITTYNNPAWLEKCFWGWQAQTNKNFTLLIADDGSTQETKALIQRYQAQNNLTIKHYWHEDLGFRKCEILNKVIAATDCDYLIFTDGDCVPAPNLVQTHYDYAEPGYFLSAGYFKLNMAVSKAVTEDDIQAGKLFEKQWLIANGQPKSHKMGKLNPNPLYQRIMNKLTPTKATWNGANSSTWTKDIIAVNGFNEDMQYGGLDRELGERLWNNGMKSKQIRYSAIFMHLDHKRGYESKEIWQKNYDIRNEVIRTKSTWTTNGIIKGNRPD